MERNWTFTWNYRRYTIPNNPVPSHGKQSERMNRTIINFCITEYYSLYSRCIHHCSPNYSLYFLLFGRNGCLPVDLMLDININNNIKNKFHSGYVQNWQNTMKEVYSKIHLNNKILQRSSKSKLWQKNIRFHFDPWRKSFS